MYIEIHTESEHEKQIREIEKRLSDLEKEKSALLTELFKLRSSAIPEKETPLLGLPALPSAPATTTEKIDLFLKLFRCRDDVYPKLWENKSKGTKGYSPVCANEWVRGVCGKPKVKCSDCQGRSFPKLDTVAVEAHLRGSATIGTYAIRADDGCIFLACDFDGDGWQEDVKSYRNAARSMGVDVAVERSRSGAGAHAWIFFQKPVPARLARLLGTVILSKCSEYRPSMSLESFDRFFPNQDYLPKGGFGNLIALPLQKLPREQGNTCFLDEELNAVPDQWGCLAQARRLSLEGLRSLVSAYLPSKLQTKDDDGFDDVSWIADQHVLEVSVDSKKDTIAGLLNGPFELRLNSQIHIPLEGLPGKIVNRLRRTASFANPEFYRRQRMRMQTYPEPRFIFSGEFRPDEMILPRGTLDSVTKILVEAGAQVIVRDERLSRKRIKATFKGELTPEQTSSVEIMKSPTTAGYWLRLREQVRRSWDAPLSLKGKSRPLSLSIGSLFSTNGRNV